MDPQKIPSSKSHHEKKNGTARRTITPDFRLNHGAITIKHWSSNIQNYDVQE